jgi:hypothetical protein
MYAPTLILHAYSVYLHLHPFQVLAHPPPMPPFPLLFCTLAPMPVPHACHLHPLLFCMLGPAPVLHAVKYRFPIRIQRRSEIGLRNEVRISKTKRLRCSGKYRNPNGGPNLYTGSEGAWLQLVCCTLLYAWCPISEEGLGGGRKSERESIGQTKSIFKLKSNYRHGLYLYKSKVLVGI